MKQMIKKFLMVLGLFFGLMHGEVIAKDRGMMEMIELVVLSQKFEECRKNKQFEDADAIRDEISGMGIHLIDHKEKTLWMKKEEIKADS